MNTFRMASVATVLAMLATPTVAQPPTAPNEPPLVTGMQPVQPVMDNPILAHVIFNHLEGRWNGTNTEFKWEGQGWVGTDYDKLCAAAPDFWTAG